MPLMLTSPGPYLCDPHANLDAPHAHQPCDLHVIFGWQGGEVVVAAVASALYREAVWIELPPHSVRGVRYGGGCKAAAALVGAAAAATGTLRATGTMAARTSGK